MPSGIYVITLLINFILFFILLIKNVGKEPHNKYIRIYRLEIAFVSITLIQYILNFIIINSSLPEDIAFYVMGKIRFVCGLIASPLALYSYYILAKDDGYKGSFVPLLVISVVMIILGNSMDFFKGNRKFTIYLNCLFLIGYGLLVWQISKLMKFFKNEDVYGKKTEKHNLGFFFIFGWLIYLVALNMSSMHEYKFILYSFTDFITKGLYSFAANAAI
jgi:hypothetical protein